jgi:hypothetical protein
MMLDHFKGAKNEPPLGRTCVQGDGSVGTSRRLTRRLAVCPISNHPGLITTMERLLANGDFKVMPLRLERDQNLHPHSGREQNDNPKHLPHASVFVLDGSSLGLGTEALIERIRTKYPRARLLVIKETSTDSAVFPYLRLGIRGIV